MAGNRGNIATTVLHFMLLTYLGTDCLITLSYTRVQILHTLVKNSQEHIRFHELQIEALVIPVSLTSHKHRCKKRSACIIFIYEIEEPYLPRKQPTEISQELSAAYQRQERLVRALWEAMVCGCACPALFTSAQQLAYDCSIYNYKMNLFL